MNHNAVISIERNQSSEGTIGGTGREQYAIVFTLQKLFNQSQHQSTVIPLSSIPSM